MASGKALRVNIRLAAPGDAEAVERFYGNNDHAFVAFRPERLATLLSERALLVAETGGLMVGAAGILPHEVTVGQRCVELVQGRVILEGVGLYRILIACRLLLIESRYPDSVLVFCEIDEINTRARSIYCSLGFVEFGPDAELERMSIGALPIKKRPESLGYGFAWYKADISVRDHIIEKFSASVIHSNSQLPDCPILSEYCEQIHSMIALRA
jgi:hypothetical protein